MFLEHFSYNYVMLTKIAALNFWARCADLYLLFQETSMGANTATDSCLGPSWFTTSEWFHLLLIIQVDYLYWHD
jgi:hypothetical protein